MSGTKRECWVLENRYSGEVFAIWLHEPNEEEKLEAYREYDDNPTATEDDLKYWTWLRHLTDVFRD